MRQPAGGLRFAAEARDHRFGVLAFRPKPETLARWQPLVDYLNAAKLGRRFELQALTYPELDEAVRNMMAFSGCSLAEAVRMATATPARLLGLERKGAIAPGFDADLLWKFRWYSILNQLLIWTTIALVFGALLDRFLAPARRVSAETPAPEPAGSAP